MWCTCLIAIGFGLAVEGAAPTGSEESEAVDPKVLASVELADALELDRWRTTGPVQMSTSEMDAPGAGAKALRIEVPQTAEARRQRTFAGEIFELAEPQDWSVYNRLALWVFVEPSKTPRGASLSVHLYNDDGIRRTTGTFVVPRGRWQRIA